MARRQRKRRLRRQRNDQRRKRSTDLRTHGIRFQTSHGQTSLRGNPRRYRSKSLGILQRTQQKTLHDKSNRRKLIGLVGKVVSSLPTTNTQNSLQTQSSIQSRKEHKCIRKPNSKTAGSGSGKYKGQWKPWCL